MAKDITHGRVMDLVGADRDYCLKLPITSRSRLEGVSGTLQLNLKSPRVASIQKASTLENSLRHHWTTTDSNLRVAANFCSKLATAYSFRLHPQGIAHLCRPGTSIHPNRL
jgi:hypothetical protein